MNEFVPWETGCKYITFLKDNEMKKKKYKVGSKYLVVGKSMMPDAGYRILETEFVLLAIIWYLNSRYVFHLHPHRLVPI